MNASIIETFFAKSTTSFWYRILPIEDHDDDISVALGIEWHYLLPLLTKGGLLRSRVTSVKPEVYHDMRE
jgi:hypothetical protein